ncbi:type 2 lantipeptide synthetase LanM family protein [Streptomyces bambusae]|uniref:type 2 lanthipeptide synthetase LanM family protein n=1 Tax=Streptomyces bambusae TaxID=1550616 RepID=UPI001CFE2160|nr:type 2 lanthipeptide synthetase LanM family protein [Streptomyces bambusae]MCB5164421.1 type 2 lantipeptide synthetase LanM family protein [Streptomyces bambusae]
MVEPVAAARTADGPPPEGWFAAPVGVFAGPLLAELDDRIPGITGLAPDEREVLREATREALNRTLQLRLNRVLLLELRAAALAGELPGADPAARWDSFLRHAATPAFLGSLHDRYPALHPRALASGRLLIDGAVELGARLAADRQAITGLLGRAPGPLRALELARGDTHQGGRAVARLVFEDAALMYKPRPVEVDAALRSFVSAVPGGADLGVPQAVVRHGYGWTEHLDHRHCRDEAELARFYRALGGWLAVMRLLGGTDLHAENLVAHGPVPAVVDAEALFTPDVDVPPSGRGDAVDRAARTIRNTVLRTGILPLRTDGYALAGVDLSAAGGLPGQQPSIRVPVIADGGLDTARMEIGVVDLPPARNHPSPEPVLIRHWDQVLTGFDSLTGALAELDARGELATLMKVFDGCRVRRVRRPTQTYSDIGRMLWHPASLHDPAAALERGRDILRRNALAAPGAPRDPDVIEGEIADLLVGDVPVFDEHVDGTQLAAFLTGWRRADLARERDTIRSALVGAYLNERRLPDRVRTPALTPSTADLDRRRRTLAAEVLTTVCAAAVRGADATATWISPVLTDFGWAIRPLGADLYTGQGGVALALAEYVQEQRAGRADPVAGAESVLAGTLEVLAATEDLTPTRPVGGFTGIASQVWTWCALHRLLGTPGLLDRARGRAALLTPAAIAEDRALDVLGGAAGVIVPLLGLAELTGEDQWLGIAAEAGRHLERTAIVDDRGARWSTAMFPEGIGGFAHGATGAGWALTRLALSAAASPADRRRWYELGSLAQDFEETLYSPAVRAWADARVGGEVDHPTAWCHGSTGIGLAAVDLHERTGDPRHPDTALRSVPAGLREGFGWSHTLCHGDLGLWELLHRVRPLGGYEGPSAAQADGELLAGIEQRGPVGGLAKEAFAPGLLPGLSGVVHHLLRMHPEARLCSPLLLALPPAPGPEQGQEQGPAPGP